MAQYEITYTCGCRGTVGVCGKVKSRQWRADLKAQKICPDCYRQKMDKVNEKAATEATEIGLPALTGTTRQIDWAESIRMDLHKASQEIELNPEALHHDLFVAALKEVFEKTKASWWIDNRPTGIFSAYNQMKNLLTDRVVASLKAREKEAVCQ